MVLLLLLPACTSATVFSPHAGRVSLSPLAKQSSTPAVTSGIPPEGRVRLNQPQSENPSVRPGVMTRDPADAVPRNSVVPVSWETPDVGSDSGDFPFTPAEPRLDPSLGRMTPADLYPDEYLVDGGDRNHPVHYFGDRRKGLDTEDTVAEYTDHLGRVRVRASSRVAVYAPRFGAVRVVEAADTDIQVSRAIGAKDVSTLGGLHRGDVPEQSVVETELVAMRSRARVDGAESFRVHQTSEHNTRPQLNSKVDQGFEGRAISIPGIFERNESPELSRHLANAAIWTRDTYPVLSASTSTAGQVRARFAAEASIGIDDERAEKSEIRVIKLADRETADAGDVIHFTIRFFNTGDYDLFNVRIADNLTPRLQYVPDSAQSDRPCDVFAQPNGEGSQLLTFEFEEPLPARKSGTIAFEVLVK